MLLRLAYAVVGICGVGVGLIALLLVDLHRR